MSDRSKVGPAHLCRSAIIYVRQSTQAQLERNRESTARQYALVERAKEFGWAPEQIVVIDEDQGLSGSGVAARSGFARLAAETALGHVGIVLGLEVSRLARNNADWYRLLELCGITDTLIGDADGIYHPGVFNDRLLLGLKGTMSEAELHVLRARLDGGIRNKAARGELRRGLPIGLVWGERDGEVLLHPDAAVQGAIRACFERFAERGSVRGVWLWFRGEGLAFPTQTSPTAPIRWVSPTYAAIHATLTNPAYGGAYAYGKTRHERVVDETGAVRVRTRRLARAEWAVLIAEHHLGYVDWASFLAIEERIGRNVRPRAHVAGGAVREGAALLQGIAVCGRCGRRLHVHYSGRAATAGYHCSGRDLVEGRGRYCLSVGGRQIEDAVTRAFLTALAPAGIEAALAAATTLEASSDEALASWRLELERARYEADRAERRYLAVEPDNRLVARGLEAAWEERLRELRRAEAELEARERRRPRALTDDDRAAIRRLGDDIARVWSAPSTTDRDRKELLRALLDEVIVRVDRAAASATLTVRWRGGALSELDVALPRSNPPVVRTAEETISLLRRLARHHPDAQIAGILNRQGRRSATGERFTASIVGSLRRSWGIDRSEPAAERGGEPVSVQAAARILGVVPSTVHRWINDGFIAAEQITPGSPWRIRITTDLRARFVEEAPPGWLPMLEATAALGVSRQTVLQRVKRGELQAVHVRSGRRRGLRIELPKANQGLFDEPDMRAGAV